MIGLKANIEKDRCTLDHLERKIEQGQTHIVHDVNELSRNDSAQSWENRDTQIQISSLNEQLNEMRRNFDDANSKREWAEVRLKEVHSQMQLFNPVNDSLSQLSNQRSKRKLEVMRPQSEQIEIQKFKPPMVPQPIGGRNRLQVQNILQHADSHQPYKSLREFSAERLQRQRSEQKFRQDYPTEDQRQKSSQEYPTG